MRQAKFFLTSLLEFQELELLQLWEEMEQENQHCFRQLWDSSNQQVAQFRMKVLTSQTLLPTVALD